MTQKKRYVPQERKEEAHFLEAQPVRDIQALILPLSLIVVPANIRTELTEIEELAGSIGKNGLLQPLVVSRVDEHFELVAGQRRYAAIKVLGWETAPVRILNADAEQIACLRVIENIQRQELSGVDEVCAISKLLPIFNQNQSSVGRAIGKDQAYVSRCVRAAKWLADNSTYAATHTLTKTMLFHLTDSKEPEKLLEEIKTGNVATTREARKLSGALPGGRFGAEGAVQFKERSDGKSFSLRLNFDTERTPDKSRMAMIDKLEEILKRLRLIGEK